jgi:hypothetical protein
MSFANPENLIRSWNLQTGFSTGPVVADQLVPKKFGRIRTPFVLTWREEKLNSILDFSSQNFSVYLPESLRVLKEAYLKIEVPALASPFKEYPGLHFIDKIRILSAGQEVYVCDYHQHLVDYLQQLRDEDSRQFGKTYLGWESVPSNALRTIMLPILLPNSPFLLRDGKDLRGHGIFPSYLGQNRLEIQFTMKANTYQSANGTDAVPSISGKCSMMYRECQMTPSNKLAFGDARGKYSVITRRFTELTSGWQDAAANVNVTWNINQPQGIVTEVIVLAVPDEDNVAKRQHQDFVKPTKIKVTADSIVQLDMDSPEKIQIALYENGFDDNTDFPQPARICFASHCCDNSYAYTGGYNQQIASTIQYDFTFAEAVHYKLIAVQLQRVRIDALGRLTAKLD